MKENIMKYINSLEGFKTAIKNQHWNAKNMSTHKLFDDIASSVSDIQDVTAEIAQGLYGQIDENELKPETYTIENGQQFLNDMLSSTKEFYSTIKEGDDYIGMRSEIEAFIAEINKFQYLLDLCIKENKKSQRIVTENNHRYLKLNETEFKAYINECVNQVLKELL